MEKPEERIYTMIELIEQFKEGTLPKDVVVFKYQSKDKTSLVHRDELQREAIVSGIYSTMHQDKLIGTKTAPDHMSGVDKSKWTKVKRQ
jgi:hypothetical protein